MQWNFSNNSFYIIENTTVDVQRSWKVSTIIFTKVKLLSKRTEKQNWIPISINCKSMHHFNVAAPMSLTRAINLRWNIKWRQAENNSIPVKKYQVATKN